MVMEEAGTVTVEKEGQTEETTEDGEVPRSVVAVLLAMPKLSDNPQGKLKSGGGIAVTTTPESLRGTRPATRPRKNSRRKPKRPGFYSVISFECFLRFRQVLETGGYDHSQGAAYVPLTLDAQDIGRSVKDNGALKRI